MKKINGLILDSIIIYTRDTNLSFDSNRQKKLFQSVQFLIYF